MVQADPRLRTSTQLSPYSDNSDVTGAAAGELLKHPGPPFPVFLSLFFIVDGMTDTLRFPPTSPFYGLLLFLINFFLSLPAGSEAGVSTVGGHSLCETLEQRLFLATSGPNVLTESILEPDPGHGQDEVFTALRRHPTRNVTPEGRRFPPRRVGRHRAQGVGRRSSFLGKTQ